MSLKDYRLYEDAHYNALESAATLKVLLGKHKLNVVTAESLTAGMIVKMLVDVPGNGGSVYGGFAVYDTDAKRQMLGVKTEGVYSHKTAYQMAEGALMNSRAAVSIAVTGNAMVTRTDLSHMGQVFFGIGLRVPDAVTGAPFTIKTYATEICNETAIKKVCDDWKVLHGRGGGQPAPFQITSILADYIRLRTVKMACDYAVSVIDGNIGRMHDVTAPFKEWDRYCKPSWILNPFVHSSEKSTVDCDPYADRNYDEPRSGHVQAGGSKRQKSDRKRSNSRRRKSTRRSSKSR